MCRKTDKNPKICASLLGTAWSLAVQYSLVWTCLFNGFSFPQAFCRCSALYSLGFVVPRHQVRSQWWSRFQARLHGTINFTLNTRYGRDRSWVPQPVCTPSTNTRREIHHLPSTFGLPQPTHRTRKCFSPSLLPESHTCPSFRLSGKPGHAMAQIRKDVR